MAQRLQNRGSYWGAALIALAFSSTIASTGLLFQAKIYGAHGDVLLVIVAVFTLVASLTVANTDYPAKGRRGFEAYRRLQRLSVRLATSAGAPPRRAVNRRRAYAQFDREYQLILDESDNHSPADYGRAIRFAVRSKKEADDPHSARFELLTQSEWVVRRFQIVGSNALTLAPILLTICAILFAVPSLVWAVSGFPK